MSKRWQPSVKLITTGIIISDLHFGTFLRDWWYIRMTLQENGIRAEQYYPFQVGMKIQVEIKNRPFIIRVVQGNNNSLPRFLFDEASRVLKFYEICQADGKNDQEIIKSLGFVFTKPIFYLKNFKDNYSKMEQIFNRLALLYPSNYIFSKREIRAWQAMLRAIGCVNITPFDKKESEIKFWTRSPNPESNKAVINMLYHNADSIEKFWNSFEHSLNLNQRDNNGKQRILSIIADNFSYEELETKLHVSSHMIHIWTKNGPGCPAISKPPMKKKSCLENMKINLNGLPLKCLSNQKETLWEKFHKSFPNGMKRTAVLNKAISLTSRCLI
ncbi:hypothetical protein Glove_64g62 [Diversispora epigaea]|uniref:Uncharacterized protein n=1 Tax=Diversispora epigaea TaxID=1348612 RepID=A0A397JM54_9GLOM|nr:hypothetical protein Glove_64g62 [Diversispora epigaea]